MPNDDVSAAIKQLTATIQDKKTTRALKRLQRAVASVPEGQPLATEFAILLDLTAGVTEAWEYIARHPDEIRDGMLFE